MTQDEERALIDRILAGDRDAFADIVEAHQTHVYQLALRMTGNPEDALDISQEVFLKAYTELGRFRGDSRLSVWLFRVTYNLCLDLRRKQKRHPTVSLLREDEDGEETELEFPDLRYAPETEAERQELHEAVEHAVASLSPEHQEILRMREFGDLSYADMAASLGISQGTVKSRLARAREKAAGLLLSGGTFSSSGRQKDGKGGGTHGNL